MADLITPTDDPFTLFHAWMHDAEQHEPNDPNAMALATADSQGMPAVRMVLLKGVSEGGFVFYTNSDSMKGQHLDDNPQAGLCFHWKSLCRQIRIQGPVTRVTADEADAYFATRHKGSQIGAWASQQSRPLADRETLQTRVSDFHEQYKDNTHAPRPPYWNGYRVKAQRIEFWSDGECRLHDRFVYTRDKQGQWTAQRLFP